MARLFLFSAVLALAASLGPSRLCADAARDASFTPQGATGGEAYIERCARPRTAPSVARV
jgi:hypothetical protein